MNSELDQADIDVVSNDFVFNDILVQIPDVELAAYLFHIFRQNQLNLIKKLGIRQQNHNNTRNLQIQQQKIAMG